MIATCWAGSSLANCTWTVPAVAPFRTTPQIRAPRFAPRLSMAVVLCKAPYAVKLLGDIAVVAVSVWLFHETNVGAAGPGFGTCVPLVAAVDADANTDAECGVR